MIIEVESLSKRFEQRRRTRPWPFGRVESTVVEAVRGVDFSVSAGERVAFIGPNGAGKSTTLKMLSGILMPSGGRATVAGLVPWQDRRRLALKIGLVFGQRSQLWYHLPVRRSLELLAVLYGIDPAVYHERLSGLIARFDLSPLIDRPVKALSLGQRMRCEIAASLLHAPQILFLDEPTIGLDIPTRAALRDHLRALSETDGTTVILTSHDTADIETVCDRVIVIDHGVKLIDTPLETLQRTWLSRKRLVLQTAEERPALIVDGVLSQAVAPHQLSIEIDPAATPVASVIAAALQALDIKDIAVSDPPLEEVIAAIYSGGQPAAAT